MEQQKLSSGTLTTFPLGQSTPSLLPSVPSKANQTAWAHIPTQTRAHRPCKHARCYKLKTQACLYHCVFIMMLLNDVFKWILNSPRNLVCSTLHRKCEGPAGIAARSTISCERGFCLPLCFLIIKLYWVVKWITIKKKTNLSIDPGATGRYITKVSPLSNLTKWPRTVSACLPFRSGHEQWVSHSCRFLQCQEANCQCLHWEGNPN